MQEIDWMAFAERVWIRCNWGDIPGEDGQRCIRLANDFASIVLKRDLDLFRTDYPHLLGFIKRQRFIALDLHCEGLEISVDQVPFRCFIAKYDVDHNV